MYVSGWGSSQNDVTHLLYEFPQWFEEVGALGYEGDGGGFAAGDY